MNVALIVIIGSIILSFYLVIKAKKGKDMDLEQWTVGGRGFGAIFMFLLIAGEAFTITTFLGSSGQSYSNGGAALFIMCYGTLAYVISYFILPKIWQNAKQNKLVSQSDFFVTKYNSPYLGVLVAIIGVIAMIPYFIIQLNGLGIIVSQASYGTISPNIAICIGAIVITVYVLISGIHGSAWTAVVKDFLLLFIVVFLGIYLPIHYYGGIGEMFEAIQEARPGFLALPESGQNPSWFLTTVLISSLGFYMWPHLFSATYSAQNAKVFRKNAILMPLYQLVLLFIFFIGSSAILIIPGLQGKEVDLILLKLSAQTFDPWFVGLVGAGGIFAALVPGSMLLMNASTMLAKNVYKVLKPETSEEQISKIAKYLVPVIAGVSLYLSIYGGKTIVALLVMGYSLVTQLFPALLFSLSKNNFVTKQGAFAGISIGVLTVAYISLTNTTIGMLFPFLPQVIKDFNVGIIALGINVLVLVVVSLVTRGNYVQSKVTEETEGS
ncbi:sodium:solute symporter family protein [Lysinibacillus agricola]|uniref:Sodium:solute symporter family protein n=1 Tax=Lysinibacillus agricola TaxID=2590012 RepID=A0ABX7AWE7_9BACI|nr:MULTISPECIES: sodium:solute symporter family protein [Lysinibacillus]KOS64197.1 sodium:solute symporter [Lysinibacillus sp. FJAT-14222]QQP14308.1 sodium:solute symporter family protein [Lysinibacillus agricola]